MFSPPESLPTATIRRPGLGQIALGWLLSSAMTFAVSDVVGILSLPRFPVEGRVSQGGAPVPGAVVRLHPLDGRWASRQLASGHVLPDGHVSLHTLDLAQGVPAGTYAVTIHWHKRVIDGEDYRPGPNVLPVRYADPRTTPLQVRIVAGVAPPCVWEVARE